MADVDLRELERRWRESGAVEDEARWLRALMRAGELESWRLERLAGLGHSAARSALGTDEPVSPLRLNDRVQPDEGPGSGLLRSDVPTDWAEWALGQGPPFRMRVALAVAATALPTWADARPEDRWAGGILRSAENWLACPCKDHSRALDRAWADGHPLRKSAQGTSGQDRLALENQWAHKASVRGLLAACYAVRTPGERWVRSPYAGSSEIKELQKALDAAALVGGRAALEARLCERLAAYLLGMSFDS